MTDLTAAPDTGRHPRGYSMKIQGPDNKVADVSTKRRPTGNPYRDYPERDSWDEGVLYERPDLTRYSIMTTWHRWAASYAEGETCEREVTIGLRTVPA